MTYKAFFRMVPLALLLLALPSGVVPAQGTPFPHLWAGAVDSVAVLSNTAVEIPASAESGSWWCELLTPAQAELSAWEKLLYLAGASVGFALFDYVCFNATRTNPGALKAYRIAQVMVQTGISYVLFKEVSAATMVGFNLVWWSFGDDFIYYGFAEMFNPADPWENRGDFNHKIMGNRTTWAFWTPVGIVRGMNRSRPIAGNMLIAQALVGAALAVTVTVTF